MNQITVLFFATMRDHIGERKITLDIPAGTDIRGLKAVLAERYPNAAEAIEVTLVSINRDYAFEESEIPAGAEIAMFPHVSGG